MRKLLTALICLFTISPLISNAENPSDFLALYQGFVGSYNVVRCQTSSPPCNIKKVDISFGGDQHKNERTLIATINDESNSKGYIGLHYEGSNSVKCQVPKPGIVTCKTAGITRNMVIWNSDERTVKLLLDDSSDTDLNQSSFLSLTLSR